MTDTRIYNTIGIRYDVSTRINELDRGYKTKVSPIYRSIPVIYNVIAGNGANTRCFTNKSCYRHDFYSFEPVMNIVLKKQ